MSIVNILSLESNRQIKINFDGGDLSSDAGLLLLKEFAAKIGFTKLIKILMPFLKRTVWLHSQHCQDFSTAWMKIHSCSLMTLIKALEISSIL